MSRETYDVIVVGAGPTGENVADYAVKGGLSAVVVESELVGGECSYWACIPSKALLRPPAALGEARGVDGAKQAVTGQLDAGAVLARRDAFAHHWKDDRQLGWLDTAHIALVRGHGRLAGERRVDVTQPDGSVAELEAGHAVVIATGTSAAVPPVPGLQEARPWTSREATSAQAAPASLMILGGGVVGCEMATAWRSLGTKEVTIVQLADRLVPGVEPFASALLAEGLRRRGVRVLLSTVVREVSRDGGGPVHATLSTGETIVADECLVAAGRAPRTGDVGLETVGLTPGSWLEVDDTLQVTAVEGGWLYAAGDVNHRVLLTHQGKYQGRACGQVIAARARGDAAAATPPPWSRYVASADHACVPQVIFTDPEIAAVGLTEQQALDRGYRARAADYELGQVAGASLFADDFAGHARMVVDEDRGVLLGATLVGTCVAELLHAATVAIAGEVPLDRLWHAVPSYPTISEIWLRLLEAYGR